MWFEHAVGKEKINFMFNNDFPLFDLELISFSFNVSSLRLSFSCKNIPVEYPKKWDRKDFNSLLLSITLTDVIFFESKGVNVMFTSTPTIETTKEYSVVKIESPELYLYCKARFLTIDDIRPCVDDRWD
ncbi:MAG: Imm50 family immunity protein [Gibbsiella quercinecans]|uniref:Imm50 family immunity protein n=1 Tax=Gibbsiella quercinecans TaxID=929813 RepID=UPI003F3CB5AD